MRTLVTVEARRAWALALKNWLLPTYCRRCGDRLLTEDNGFFCPHCWTGAHWIEPPLCDRCGRPHYEMIGLGFAPDYYPCAACRETPSRYIDRVFGAGVYADVISDAVKLLKFGRRVKLAETMGQAMAATLNRDGPGLAPDVVVPVPLYRTRYRERGFNQSALLAEMLARRMGYPTPDTGGLTRIRPTRAQSSIKDPAQRRENIRGAFAVVDDRFRGRNVLLVDDVMTTGGTVEECARVLKRAGGARAVYVAVFALTLKGSRDL